MEYRWVQIMKKMQARIKHAEAKHPEGARFPNLLSEINEVQAAIKCGDKQHQIYEIYDVITVGLRMIQRLEAEIEQDRSS